MYHYIRDVNPNKDRLGYNLSISPKKFEEQIKYLVRNNYQPITFNDINNNNIPYKPIILTFDDGYEDFYKEAYPILKKYNYKAIIYLISDYIGKERYLSKEQLIELNNYGIEIGNHTKRHLDLSKLTFQDQKEHINIAQENIKGELGIETMSFSFPSGKYNQETLTYLKENDQLKFAVTTKPGFANFDNDVYELKRLRVNPNNVLSQLLQD